MYNQCLPKKLQEKAKKELNQVPGETEQNLKHIRDWLKTQPHLNARTDDLWLLNFLRGCKFSLQRTKEKLDFFYTVRPLTPELFGNRDPFLPEIQELLKAGIVLPLETHDATLVLIRLANFDIKKFNLQTIVKVALMIFDIGLYEINFSMIFAQHVLIDMEGFSKNFIRNCTPVFFKKLFLTIQKAYPLRVTGIYYINVPTYIDVILNMVKPFMTKKIRERGHVYCKDKFNKIHKHIPKSLLPKEYGGEGPSVAEIAATWGKKIESYRNWFLEDCKYRSNETKRPRKPKTSADVYGIEGSFRKLEVD